MIVNSYAYAAGGYDADAQAFFTAAGISDSGQKSAVNTLVLALKSDGIWSRCSAIYPFVGGSSSSHAVNLKTPGTYDLTFYGGITHSSTGLLSRSLSLISHATRPIAAATASAAWMMSAAARMALACCGSIMHSPDRRFQ